jgi:hypothetical protein
MASTNQEQLMSDKSAATSNRNTKWILVLVLVLAGICACSLVVGLGGYIVFGDRLQNTLAVKGQAAGLSIDRHRNAGMTEGTYRYLNVLGGHEMSFRVTEDGTATFQMEGTPDDQILIAELLDKDIASITWGGVIIDGVGPLTDAERQALSNLMESDMVHGLKYIPLDMACRGEQVVSARQLAALLFPLQMRFKYMVEDRVDEALQLMRLSQCAYGNQEDESPVNPSLIKLSASQPVPVVIGYFPFDGEGAVEASASFGPGAKNACQPALPMSTADYQLVSLVGERITRDEFGPCEAMCRGACGADCEPNNCKVTKDLRCEKDKQGRNTGNELLITSYDCGLHEGCIEHDACYDRCNDRFGCDSWGAAFCRHGWSPEPVTTFIFDMFCDESAILSYGAQDPILWMNGLGPMSKRETFEYVDQNYGQKQELDRCPVVKPEEDAEKQPQEEKPEVEYEWVLLKVEVNPNQARESYIGGGTTPGWFTEERFEGKSVTYTSTDSSFMIHDVDVDHGYTYRDVTVQIDFDALPLILEPGTREELSVSFSNSGSVYEGGSGIFVQFWYSSDEVSIQPVDFFSYAPWRENFDGSSSTDYILSVPSAESMEEFKIYASLMNAEPCLVEWTYRLEEVR